MDELHVRLNILRPTISPEVCSFMLCDLDFEPLSLSSSSLFVDPVYHFTSYNNHELEIKKKERELISKERKKKEENNKSKSDKGYHAVPPLFTGNFIPFKPDLTFIDEIVKSKNIDVITNVTPSNGKKVESNHESVDNGDVVEPKTVRKNSFRPPIIEGW
ncbi:hypothetical protein Tco_0670812, partial [Tanacetum coccineum]